VPASQWSDLSRPPLSEARLRRALARDGTWRQIDVVEATESTNADVSAAARAGAAEGLVVIAEHQSAGRGRLDRQWESPPRAGLTLSVLLRPSVEMGMWGLIPLLAGLAVVEAVSAVAFVDAGLKWPNDVLVDERKLGGLLVELAGDAAVVGVGLNVSTREAELPIAAATSLLVAGGSTDREPLAKELLRALSRRYRVWSDADGASASVLPAYRERCETIGAKVELALPGGEVVRGTAVDVDDTGRLVVADDDTGDERAWLVGDITHVRKGTGR
jgi:BirA family transcriptional regulator, biotin operon repressor / biotin---[acetyl-CoA-carboxylase] ligase